MKKLTSKTALRGKGTSSTKSKKRIRSKYGCDDVEIYIERAVTGIRNEIIPELQNNRRMIELVDKRDAEQFDSARKVITDANLLMAKRQEMVEKEVHAVREDFDTVIQTQGAIVDELKRSLGEIHEKLDNHDTALKEVSETVKIASTKATEIQNTLDTVQANGNPGLKNSLTDIYGKLASLEEVTAAARSREKFWSSLREMVDKSWIFFPFKSKVGAVFAFTILLVIVNTVSYDLFGIRLDLVSFGKWLFTVLTALGRG